MTRGLSIWLVIVRQQNSDCHNIIAVSFHDKLAKRVKAEVEQAGTLQS